MFGGLITVHEGEAMSDVERVARCICFAMHETADHWELYLPAATSVLSKFYVDTNRRGEPRLGGLLG